jgi:hypothetical protein
MQDTTHSKPMSNLKSENLPMVLYTLRLPDRLNHAMQYSQTWGEMTL